MEYLTSDLSWVLPLRSPQLTQFYKLFPMLVSETFFLVTIALGYWCWRKDAFRDLGIMLGAATLVNGLLKAIFQMPRPTIEHLTKASGWSFPSGDTMAATVFFLMLAVICRRKWITAICLLLILGAGSSRIYFGVHYPVDVLAGLAVGSLMVLAYHYIKEGSVGAYFSERKDFAAILIYLSLTVYFVLMRDFISTLIVTSAGVIWGILIGSQLEHRLVNYSEPNNGSVKFIVGFVGLLGLFVSKITLTHLFLSSETFMNRFLVFGALGFYIVFLLPFIIKKFASLRSNEGVFSA